MYKNWAKLSAEAAEVIWHRSSMMEDAKETQQMVVEKFQVLPEVGLSIWTNYLKQLTGGTHNMAQMQAAALRPIKKRVTANRMRLRKRP